MWTDLPGNWRRGSATPPPDPSGPGGDAFPGTGGGGRAPPPAAPAGPFSPLATPRAPPIAAWERAAAVQTVSDEPWKVELSLQSADEPSLVVPADQIWRARGG